MFNENSVSHACLDAFSMFNGMKLPCVMNCTSLGHVGMQMPMSTEKWYIVNTYAEMQLPCLLKNATVMFVENEIAMFTQL